MADRAFPIKRLLPTSIRSEDATRLSDKRIHLRLAALLSEPETKLVMQADGVDPDELLEMLIQISAKLLDKKES